MIIVDFEFHQILFLLVEGLIDNLPVVLIDYDLSPLLYLIDFLLLLHCHLLQLLYLPHHLVLLLLEPCYSLNETVDLLYQCLRVGVDLLVREDFLLYFFV